MGAEIAGLSFSGYGSTVLERSSAPLSLDIDQDIGTRLWQAEVADFAPQIIFHLAAQSLVFTGLHDPVGTFETNFMGSLHVLELFQTLPSIQTIIVATTDKVYEISDGDSAKIETDALGGKDPYSASKGTVELLARSWPITSTQRLLTGRSGNVIGGGDSSPKRLIPDLVRAWKNNDELFLRSPSGIRPWLHVLEPLRGYILLAERSKTLTQNKAAFNFAPPKSDHVSVINLADRAMNCLPSRDGFKIVESSNDTFPETLELLLDSSKAKKVLDWYPVWSWDTAVDKTLGWYKQYFEGRGASLLIQKDIHDYLLDLEKQPI